jgi:hypothetical protein
VYGQGHDVGVYCQGGTALIAIADTGAGGDAAYFDGRVVVTGTLIVGGVKGATVLHSDGTHRLLCAVESPESWFEDFGRAELSDGRAEVALDVDFAALIDTDGYHVFLTPEGDSSGLYVNSRTSSTFEVREQAAGRSTLGFSYRVVARRADVEHERLAVVELPSRPNTPEPRLPEHDSSPPTEGSRST